MKLKLTIPSGSMKGTEFDLGSGQACLVGRGHPARFQVPDDEAMANVHFSLECQGDICRLRDMGSEEGTLLNGQRVQEAELHPEDEITAGGTMFMVSVEGEAPPELATVEQTTPRVVTPVPPASARAVPDCEAQPCPCGFLRVVPLEPGMRPAAIIRQMAEISPLYVIANLGQLKRPVPEDLERPDFLLYRLPEEVLAEHSPVIIRDGDTADFQAILEQGWDKNSLVCLYSNSDRNDLIGHLRQVVYCTPPHPDEPEGSGVLGYYWPRIMSALLKNGQEDFMGPLIDSISAFVLESEDQPGAWQMYASREYSEQLDELQLLHVTPSDEGDSESDA